MSSILKDYDFTHPSKLTQNEARKSSYPWPDWFDGRIWKLAEGEDFLTHPLMMERIIRTKASTVGAKLKLRHEARNGESWGFIVVQNQNPDELKIKRSHPPASKRQMRKPRLRVKVTETESA